jgi:peptidoglycan L-alanyl-D-glutamate endopeptidase CwlK
MVMSDKFVGVHPVLVAKLQQIYAAMAALGAPMHPTDGCRAAGQQAILWAKGRFGNPGPIVTNCDGINTKSNHQPKADGFGHAVDSCFDGPDPYLAQHPHGADLWAAYGACCEALGLKWGGRFTTLVDKPHAELPE